MTLNLPYIPDAETAKEYFENDNNFQTYCKIEAVNTHLLWLYNSKFVSLDFYWQARKKINEHQYLDWLREGFAGGYAVEAIKPLLINHLIKEGYDSGGSDIEADRLLALVTQTSEPEPAQTAPASTSEPCPPATAPASAPADEVHHPTFHVILSHTESTVAKPAALPQSQPEPVSAPPVDIKNDTQTASEALVNAAASDPIVSALASREPIQYETQSSATITPPLPPPCVPVNDAPGASVDVYTKVLEALRNGAKPTKVKRMLMVDCNLIPSEAAELIKKAQAELAAQPAKQPGKQEAEVSQAVSPAPAVIQQLGPGTRSEVGAEPVTGTKSEGITNFTEESVSISIPQPLIPQPSIGQPELIEANAAEIQRTLRLLHSGGEIVELRALNTPQKTWSGYYDNSTEMTKDVANLSGRDTTPNTYHTLQLINPALLARRTNGMLGWMKDGETTADADVLSYRWLPLDQDPVRPSGISSSDTEKALAYGVATKIVAFLAENGIECIVADSGNGYHELVRIDLPVTDKNFVEELLKAFAGAFSSSTVSFDTKNFNPARIWKLYGTPVRKGTNLPERPWRMSKLISVPEGVESRPASKEKLQELLAKLKTMKLASASTPASQLTMPETVEREADRVGIKLGARKEYPFDNISGWKWQMNCPFNSEHKSPDAWLGLKANGDLIFSCSHNSCQPYGINAFRQKVGGFLFEKKAIGGKRRMSLVKAKGLTPQNLKWAWKGRIFSNMPNVLYGEGGLGKGFVGIDFIAYATTGRDFFDAPNLLPICDAIICCAEDSMEETLVPRAMVAEADLDHIHFMKIEEESAESIEEGLMALDVDLPRLAELVEGLKKKGAEKIVIMIDPLATYMGELDSNKDKEVRPIYTKMAMFCREHDVCMLLIAHPNKNEEASAVNRLSGAKCLTTVFRNTWLIEKHPETKGHVLMMRAKGNLFKEAPALEFHIENIEDTGIPADDGATIKDMGKLVWDRQTDHNADDVLQAVAHGGSGYKQKKEEQHAMDLLKEFLAGGAQRAEDFYERAVQVGLSERSTNKAKALLKLKKRRIFDAVYWARTEEQLDAKRTELFSQSHMIMNQKGGTYVDR